MSTALKVFLSMSCSGAALILIVYGASRLLSRRLGRRWRYYIWLVVMLRLLLPFGPEISLLGQTYWAADQVAEQMITALRTHEQKTETADPSAGAGSADPSTESMESASVPDAHKGSGASWADWIGAVWLLGAAGLLIRKATAYQGFVHYVRAGAKPVDSMETLDLLSEAAEQAGVRKPVELWVNPLVPSPLLMGTAHPCIILPGVDVPGEELRYILLHELIHCKRRDLLYKWGMQLVVCLHWFNPAVYLMERELARDCEFSCDEAVLGRAGADHAEAYGRTLLNAMAAAGRNRKSLGPIALSGNKQILKERILAVMNFKKTSGAIRLLAGALTVLTVLGASFIGIYPAAQTMPPAGQAPAPPDAGTLSAQAERYYEAGSLPLFEIAFARLSGQEQAAWLERIYEDRRPAFFAAALTHLETDAPILQSFADRFCYRDGNLAFFSIAADHMSDDVRRAWLERALEDGKTAFQSMLYDRLDMPVQRDELERKLDEEQDRAYRKAGIETKGKNRYYNGELIHVFLDLRQNKAFYVLDINPEGTADVKILRDANDEITGAAYLSPEELEELFEDRT